PSLTNRLTPAERKAFANSDHKAAKILGIAVTRNHMDQDGSLARVLADQEDPRVGDSLGEMMAHLDAKRARSRNPSAVTVFRPRRGLPTDLVKKNNKRRVAGEYTQRVVLKPLRSNGTPVEKGEKLPTIVSDDGACSFLEPGEIEETATSLACLSLEPGEIEEAETSIACKCLAKSNEEEEDLFGNSRSGFVWDVENPFATPPNAVLQRYSEIMRLGETIGPLD
ncbi:uncharacterized protein EDB93DRAFT_1056459, partial [Suillus bovinus]|uniref:uncharacterized protein n=1 Tax=Suillus bovinus TaxID=48563 RepID=UPI001B866AFE